MDQEQPIQLGWLEQKLIREAAQERMEGIEVGWNTQHQKVFVKLRIDGKEHSIRFSPDQAHHFGKDCVRASKAASGGDPAKTMLQELSEMQAKLVLAEAELQGLRDELAVLAAPEKETDTDADP